MDERPFTRMFAAFCSQVRGGRETYKMVTTQGPCNKEIKYNKMLIFERDENMFFLVLSGMEGGSGRKHE